MPRCSAATTGCSWTFCDSIRLVRFTQERSLGRRQMTQVIRLEGLGKRYWQLHEPAMLLKSLVPGYRPKRSELWAVRDLDLAVEEGSTVGILGHNGAGKTTLLRMLAGVSRPSEGSLRVTGRIAPLIGIGVGFHQEMSGRENVYVNGMLLGLRRSEVAARFDEIVAFSELEEFIDTPVKFYSSGMLLRLGFSVAIHVRPQILLVDEILAVGDLSFQRKCFDRMRELQAQGTTILVVSHSMLAIQLLCPRAVLLRHGRLEMDGRSEDVIARHHELQAEAGGGDGDEPVRPVEVLSRALEGREGDTNLAGPGDLLVLRTRLRFERAAESPVFFFRVTTEDGQICYQRETLINQRWAMVDAGQEVEVRVPFSANLAGGTYRVGLIVSDRQARRPLLSDVSGLTFYVSSRLGTIGIADLDARILVDGRPLSDYGATLRPAEDGDPVN